jgi:hypothetical protein
LPEDDFGKTIHFFVLSSNNTTGQPVASYNPSINMVIEHFDKMYTQHVAQV